MTDQDHLDRINALTKNARATWFLLLAALVFVTVTLMSVEHIDFYGIDRATALPLVNVSVPTRYFFVAAPILVAAIYSYFHLYLIRLWDALGAAPVRLNGIRLGDAVVPWLVTDASLYARARLRRDNSATPRVLETGAMALNLLLAWIASLLVLAAVWWLSMPARTFWITGLAALALLASLGAGAASLVAMITRLRSVDQDHRINLFETAPFMSTLLVLLPTMWMYSYQRTEGAADSLVSLNMEGENIVERPPQWLPYEVAKAEFRATWCRREALGKDCRDFGEREGEFEAEFITRRQISLGDMRRPNWNKQSYDKPDLRKAMLSRSFLAGADLEGADMQGVILWEADMEGANLSGANMQEAILGAADMQGANLNRADMQKANLKWTDMQGAYIGWANMQEANLSGANMQKADLGFTNMEGAFLSGANMHGANLERTDMQGANLSGANMQGADLSAANMHGANLSAANMHGALFDLSALTGRLNTITVLETTNLNMVVNDGGMLRFVDMRPADFDSATDFRNAFLDGSTIITEAFRAQMGDPCQWVDDVLTDDRMFYGYWRGWVEASPYPRQSGAWNFIGPEEYRDVPPIPPPPGCTWKTDPMPGNAIEAKDQPDQSLP